MFFKNSLNQKIISLLLIIGVMSPVMIVLSMPRETLATGFPVFDLSLFLKEVWKVIKEIIKQFLMKIARILLDKMTQSTVNWVNSGFKDKPLYVKNPGSFFGDLYEQEIKGFVSDIGYDRVRFPYGKNYALRVIDDAKSTFEQNAEYSLNRVLADSSEVERRRNSFAAGGWDDLWLNTQNMQNNFLGFKILAKGELNKRLSSENSPITRIKEEIKTGQGFFSPKTCLTNPNWDETKLKNGLPDSEKPKYTPPPVVNGSTLARATYDIKYAKDLEAAKVAYTNKYSCQEGPINTTPGAVVASNIMGAFGSKFRQSELGAALGNSLAALFDALFNKLLNTGLSALDKATTKQTNPTVDSNPNVSDFNYYGDTSGTTDYYGNPPTNPEGSSEFKNYLDEATTSSSTSDNPYGQLKIEVNIVNDSGGSLTLSDLQIFIDGKQRISSVVYSLNPGIYIVSQSEIPLYNTTISGDCAPDGTITLSAGDNKVCIITNDDQ